MIVPGANNFTGYIGSTFDTVITVYPSVDSNYTWEGDWLGTQNYSAQQVVIAADNNAYLAILASVNINPVGDLTGHWSATPLTPLNLTGYTAAFNMGTGSAFTTPIPIQGSSGLMNITLSPTQTGQFIAGSQHYYIAVTQPNGAIYYFMNGSFTWTAP